MQVQKVSTKKAHHIKENNSKDLEIAKLRSTIESQSKTIQEYEKCLPDVPLEEIRRNGPNVSMIIQLRIQHA